MKHFLKVLALTGMLAVAAGHWQPCFADTNAVTVHAASDRTYVGRVTRTGPSGKKTVGEITLRLTPKIGFVVANVTLDGKTRTYSGNVTPVARNGKAAPTFPRQRTGTLSRLRLSHEPLAAGGGVAVIDDLQLGVNLTKNGAFGGGTTRNGSNVEFSATRFTVTLGNALPGGTVTVPIAVGTVPTTGDGG